jgi:hypothetical protein
MRAWIVAATVTAALTGGAYFVSAQDRLRRRCSLPRRTWAAKREQAAWFSPGREKPPATPI